MRFVFFILIQIDIDPCFPNPCRNGASCFNVQDDFHCHCTKDRKGRYCDEIKTTCDSDTCQGIRQFVSVKKKACNT